MEIKSAGFWGATCNSWPISDEAAISSSSSPSEEHMMFESTPNVQVYLENEEAYLLVDDLIDLADDLKIPNELKIDINKKRYTVFTNQNGVYISGINEHADAYYFERNESNTDDIVYINSSEYSKVLKRVIMHVAKIKWERLMQGPSDADNDSSCEKSDYTDAQRGLFRTLYEHYIAITNKDLAEIISSKKRNPRVWTDLNSKFLKEGMSPGRLVDFMHHLQTQRVPLQKLTDMHI